jgi:PST family polysaccharide transporter
MSLSARTGHALAWSLLGEATTRLVAPLVLLVLARLLVPADFGVVAAAPVLVSFSQTLADAGLGRAIVQRADRVDESSTTAFWMNLVLAGAVMLALVAAAPAIATFFRDARITDVVRVLALQVPLAAMCTVQVARLQRELAFKELFVVRLATAALPALVSIPMALHGHGYWALVAGTLVGQLLQVATLWWRSPWRPALAYDRALARELMQFGAWATLSAVLAWFYAWMDALVVGRFLGANDMGIYRTASTLVTMLFGLAFAPLLPVLYSVLSRAGHDVAATGRSLLRFSDAVTFVALPMAAVIALCGPWIEVVAFGPAWAGMGLVIALLAAGQGLAWTVGANGEAYRAIGKPKLEAMAMVLSSLAYLAGYLVSVQHGLMAFVMTRVLLVAVGIGIQVGIARHSFGIRIREWLAILTLPAASSGLAYAAAVLAPLSELDGAAETLARIAVLLSVLGIMVAAWGRERWGRIRRLLHVA